MTPYAVNEGRVRGFRVRAAVCWFVFYVPDYLGHPDNYVEANPLSTPPHIVPEWYFLPTTPSCARSPTSCVA